MRRNGFTLIELVMVMAMITVIAAIVLPRLDYLLPQRRLKSAARSLSSLISLAYGEAISKNKTYRLYLDSSNDRYWVTQVSEFEGDTHAPTAIGMRIGTQFELLQYEEEGGTIEEQAPTEPLFAPRELPAGIHFLSVQIQRTPTRLAVGPQYIEFSPLGNADPATINLVSDEEEQFVIRYDGVTGMPSLIPLNTKT